MAEPRKVRAHPCSKIHFLNFVGPVGARGMHAASQLEGFGIELEGGDIDKGVLVGIEKLVIVNRVVLAEDPLAVRTEIGLRGLALDLVAQGLLALIGRRNVELVEEEQAGADARRR